MGALAHDDKCRFHLPFGLRLVLHNIGATVLEHLFSCIHGPGGGI